MAKGEKLSEKQRTFVNEYLKDHNASAAAVRTGYKGKNANVVGPRLLATVGIAKEIEKRLAKAQENSEITIARVVKKMAQILECDVRKAYRQDGTLKAIGEIPDDVAVAISSIESDDSSGEVRKVRLWDKVGAAKVLGQHLGMFVDRVQHSGNVNVTTSTPRQDMTRFSDEQLDALEKMTPVEMAKIIKAI